MACRKIVFGSSQPCHAFFMARAFSQLSSGYRLHPSLPLLDFLTPSLTPRLIQFNHSQLVSSVPPRRQIPGKQTFTSSSCRRATAIVNPQKTQDGKWMEIEITPRASKRLAEIMVKDGNPNLALRIQVESGGCHGFQYLMSLTTLPPLPSSQSAESQLEDPSKVESDYRESLGDDDVVFEAGDGGSKVVMDMPSLELLKGSKVDYTMELIGSQFKIVDNPLATSSCGCGTSFDIKT